LIASVLLRTHRAAAERVCSSCGLLEPLIANLISIAMEMQQRSIQLEVSQVADDICEEISRGN
jgi:hypothetical protein